MMNWPVCPINGLACKAEGCGWFCKEEGRCAIALLPDTLYTVIRIAATQPYEKTEETEI